MCITMYFFIDVTKIPAPSRKIRVLDHDGTIAMGFFPIDHCVLSCTLLTALRMFCKTMFLAPSPPGGGEGSGVWKTPVDRRLNRIDLPGTHTHTAGRPDEVNRWTENGVLNVSREYNNTRMLFFGDAGETSGSTVGCIRNFSIKPHCKRGRCPVNDTTGRSVLYFM